MKSKHRSKVKPIKTFCALSEKGFVNQWVEHPLTEKYSNRINDKIRADYGVIEEVVSHAPSIGNYYERILASNLMEYIPSNWKSGTGFIFDDVHVSTSPQIDILVYEDNTLTPIFRAGDLVVVRPEQVIGIVEVKKRLTLGDVDKLVEKYLFANTGAEFQTGNGIQFLNVFSYERATSLNKYYERTIAALERNLKRLRNPENPGLFRSVPAITLPRLYFLDDHQLVNTSLNKEPLRYTVKVSLEGILYSSGGASDLFSRFIWHRGSEPTEKVLLSTIGLYEPLRDTRIDSPVLLREFISAERFFSRFSQTDIARLKTLRLADILGFYQPYGTNIATADELSAALKSGVIAARYDNKPWGDTQSSTA